MSAHLLYVTTCSRNYNKAILFKRHIEKQTPFLFVFAQPSSKLVDPYIIVNSEESYAQLPLKTYWILKHFLDKTTNDYLLKSDDDTFFDFKNINYEGYDYGGVINKHTERAQHKLWNNYRFQEYKPNNYQEYFNKTKSCDYDYACGGFYFLSRKAVKYILDNSDENYFINTPETYVGEDRKVGYIISKNKNLKILNMKVQNDLDLEICTNYSVIHPVRQILFSKLQNKTNIEKYIILKKYDFINDNLHINNFMLL